MQNEELSEQLSALVDDELRREEAAFLTRRLGRDSEAIDQLGRYFLISDALRRQLPDTVDLGLANRVSAALAEEPALTAGSLLGRRFIRPLAGLGVAASVAMVAVTLWSGDSAESGAVAQVAGAPVVAAGAPPIGITTVSASEGQWDRLDPAAQQRLNVYILNHSEHSSTGQLGGVLNYVRIAGQPQND